MVKHQNVPELIRVVLSKMMQQPGKATLVKGLIKSSLTSPFEN